MAKVLIIVPCYNAINTIAMTLQSLFNQTFQDKIICVVNDCSDDGTLNFLSKIKRPDFMLINNNKNIGCYPSINRALKEVKNWDYFILCGADDYNTPDRVNRQIKAIRESGKEISFSKYVRINLYTKTKQAPSMGHSNFCISKKAFDKLGYFDPVRFGADTDYYYRIRELFGKDGVAYVYDVLYYAYYFGNNLTVKIPMMGKERQEYKEIIKKRYKLDKLD